ncbi:MAG TPA: patatin-like phospholipase family protein [Beutenbergiaceae bacterium]|nr:patatin-like phospholipase family protein [Beutenbergiaceae bacterium]
MGSSVWARGRRRLARWIWPGVGPGTGTTTATTAEDHLATPPQAEDRRVGLVIAGGGARSSFQLGALRYLYDTQRITPDLISGTSAGAILGAVLAQHPDHEGQRRALGQLEQIWLGMRHSSDMFTEQPWFTSLRHHIPTWRKVMALRQRPANRTSLAAGLSDLLAKPKEAVQRLTGATEAERTRSAGGTHQQTGSTPTTTSRPKPDPADHHTAANSGIAAQAAPGDTHPADPRAGATAQINTPPEREQTWTPAHALETLSTLWEAGRSSADLDFILRGARADRSAFTPGPIVDELLQDQVFQPARTAGSEVALRIAVVSLESGELRYVDGLGRLRDRNGTLIEGVEPVDMVDAVRASCAIPGVFPPVALSGEHYVDGGARENVPAEIALAAQVDTCYAVVAAPNGVPPESSYAHKDLMAILLRTTAGIMTDEVQRNEIAYARHHGAVIIQPELDIHDLVTIDPGLISIAMDYGYLRAGDVCEDAGPARLQRTREVIQLRRLIWTTEDELFNPATAEETSLRSEDVGDLKLRLKQLIEDPGSAHLPPEAASWWQQWERHPFTIEYGPTWVDPPPATPQPE